MQKIGETTAKFRGLPGMAELEQAQRTEKSVFCYAMKMAWRGAKCVEMLQSWEPVKLRVRKIQPSPTNKRAYSMWVEIAANVPAGQIKAEFEGDGGLARWTEGARMELEYQPEENEHYLNGTF